MKPDKRWNEVDGILQSVLERSPAERAAYVDEVCSGDEELRRRVLTLIGSHERAGSFMASPALQAGEGIFEGGPRFKRGDVVGPYSVTRPVGRGGMGEVYLALHTTQNREVALKILPEHFLDDAQRIQRFRQEAQAVLTLNHPNIVTVYEIGEAAGTHYISTEFIEGQTLRERMGSARLGIEEAVDIALQVAGALAYAHERGVIHRDVKPENVMLRPDGYVKILDFGIAKLTERRGATGGVPESKEAQTRMKANTTPGMVMGTVHYMSPEQARGLPVDERTDTWSLGVILYEMLTGLQPFDGETPSDVISVIIQRDSPPPLSESLSGAPAELERIVSKALDKSKDERYQTAKDFQADLRRFKRRYEHDSGIDSSTPLAGARLMSPGVSTDGVISAVSTAGAGGQTTSSAEYIVNGFKRHRKGVLTALAALVVLAVAGLGLYQLLNRDRADQTAGAGSATRALKFTPLPVNGTMLDGAISPDGKYAVYSLKHDGREVKVSLWVRHLPTGTAVQILPPTSDYPPYMPFFSADSNYIYYGQFSLATKISSVNKISVLGGAPKRLIENIGKSDFALSPDGKQIALGRSEPNGELKMFVANEDGTNERLLAARNNTTEWFASLPVWSPDGKTLVCVTGSSVGGNNYTLLAINVADGAQRQIGEAKWARATTPAWLGDGSGLMLSVADSRMAPRQVWHVSYPDGAARRITNDLNDYQVSSVTSDSKTLLAVKTDILRDVWAGPVGGDASQLKQLTFTRQDEVQGGAWAPDGRLLFTSSDGMGNHNLWVMNADGSDRRQITNGTEYDYSPSSSPDGRHVFFTSRRGGGTQHIWRVDVNGSNLKQLTSGLIDDTTPLATPSGEWVLFNSFRGGKYSVWKVAADGGEPVQLSKSLAVKSISPDGRLLACYDHNQQSGRMKIFILPIEGGEPAKVLELPEGSPENVVWTADGRGLTILKSAGSVDNVWVLPLDGGQLKQLTHFNDPSMTDFGEHALSRDGKLLAVTRITQNSDLVLITDFK